MNTLGLELIFNVALLIFSIYCFFYVGTTSPAATATELGAAFWPRIILILLVILVIVNILNILKKNKSESAKDKLSIEGIKNFFTSKLFIGMVIVIIMVFALDYLGFMLTTFLFIMAYGVLLGMRSPVKLLLTALFVTVLLYVLFQGALGIMLPRGYGFLRTFALWIETIMPSL